MAGNGFVVRVPKIAGQSADSQLYGTLRDMLSKTNDQLAKCAAATDLTATAQSLVDLASIVAGLVAADIPVTPTGAIAATNVQAALAELDSEKSALAHTHSTSSLTDVAASTYTPTLTNVANVASTSGAVAYYMRVGNVVHVSGSVLVTLTAGSVATKLGISLPIASNFTNEYDCSGHMNRDTGAFVMGRVIGDITNDRAQMECYANADAFGRSHYFSFTYVIK